MAGSILVCFFMAGGSYAYTSFDTTCTVPTRLSTMCLLQTPEALSTSSGVACSRNRLHLDDSASQYPRAARQPQGEEGRHIARRRFLAQEPKPGFFHRLRYDVNSQTKVVWADLVWGTKSFVTSLKWMLITVLAPEMILGMAVGELVEAWRLREKMERYAMEDNVEWSLSHGFFANMGGFRVIARDEKHSQQDQDAPAPQDLNRQDSQSPKAEVSEVGRRELSGTAAEQLPDAEKASVAGASPDPSPKMDGEDIAYSYILSGQDIYHLRRNGIIDRLPCITTDEIHDKSKSNVFVKVLAMAQIFWGGSAGHHPECPRSRSITAGAGSNCLLPVCHHHLPASRPETAGSPGAHEADQTRAETCGIHHQFDKLFVTPTLHGCL